MIHSYAGFRALNENTSYPELHRVAKGVDYDTFLDKTDAVNTVDMLYRGGELGNDVFMTDYIGHAREYGDDVAGIIYDYGDVLRITDAVFDQLRRALRGLGKNDLLALYRPYFDAYKLSDAMIDRYESEAAVIAFVHKFLGSTKPYTTVQQNKVKNDLLVPLLTHYALTQGKNIITFLGGDYGDYGGADEYVVHDPSRYPTLKQVWSAANAPV